MVLKSFKSLNKITYLDYIIKFVNKFINVIYF